MKKIQTIKAWWFIITGAIIGWALSYFDAPIWLLLVVVLIWLGSVILAARFEKKFKK